MQEHLEGVKSRAVNQLARRRRFESNHVKPGRRGRSSCSDGMSSAPPGVPGTRTHALPAVTKTAGLAATTALRSVAATAQASLPFSSLLRLHHRHLSQLHVPALVQTGRSPGWPGYPTALRQTQIQGMREPETEEVVWAKTCLEIPRLPQESSARARFFPAGLSRFLSAATQHNVFSFQDHGLLHQTKDFPATVSFLKNETLSTMHCCPLLANTHK